MAYKNNKSNFVGILTFDRLDLTKRAVNSVLENSVEDIRLIFHDNGSRDGTLDYLADLKDKYSGRVDVLESKSNLGVAAGRNRIFKYVISNYGDQFSWILNLDNDCIVHEGYDKAISDCIRETNAYVVYPKLIKPNGKVQSNPDSGFLINLNDLEIKLEYGEKSLDQNDPRVSKRIKTDIILGTSAKTPVFLDKVGFYDEGHKIGLEDISIGLKATGVCKEDFLRWKREFRHGGRNWVRFSELARGELSPLINVFYEPKCVITHDHPVTEQHKDYNSIRWNKKVIGESIDHFEKVWGVRPVD